MCGIAGDVRFDGSFADARGIASMMDVLAPRGPDGAGLEARGPVAFGHRRLRIIDLSDKAAQPMVDPELGLTLTFNGCIYNYPELRTALEAKGYRFFSHGDTEVILKAYHAWGEACVERFHGMFAFAIAERDSGAVVLARDRFGIKPLYYTEGNKRLRFASSLPALLAAGDVDTSIDRDALHNYMSFHAVVPPPRTILKGVRKLPPATVRRYAPDGSFTERVYWQPPYERRPEDAALSADDWRDRVLDALRTAVRRRMVADVPVGVLLSGGVDSSIIVGLLAQEGQKDLAPYSIGFEEANGEKGDEFVYSDLIAKHFGTNHHKIFVPSSDLMGALPDTIHAMSEPMVSYDNIGFYLLSREVSKSIKVVQSGQGADEVFAGYHWYPPLADSHDVVGDYARGFFDRDHATLARQLGPQWLADSDVSRDLVAAHLLAQGAATPVDRALRLDSQVMLVDDPVKRVD
ncbi:MAG: N-acetylglutaminylglutamine amidotransferase, partial [Starkeya sp.]|nr:N-acetylglutaminylglutamine amidotransferase [Starkeya sp.]